MAQKKIIKSIKGSEVDFDLMKVKQNMLGRSKPDGVEVREQYIDIRRRRNPRRNVADLEREQQQNQEDARARIQKSKENRVKSELESADDSTDLEPVEVKDSPAVIKTSDIVETSPTKPKKKIVKKTD